MTNTYKRVSAALLSVLLLCMFTFGASAASSLNVGIKFWKERSDKESMANTGIDASRDVTLTRQSNGTYTLTLPIQQVSTVSYTHLDVYKRQLPYRGGQGSPDTGRRP